MSGFKSLGYGLVRRVLGLHVYHVYAIETTAAIPAKRGEIEYRFLSPVDVRRFATNPDNDLGDEIHLRLDGGLDSYFAAISAGKLLNYSWYATDSIEAEHTCGSPVSFPPRCAYFYKAYTHPDFRGRGINQIAILAALGEFARRGIQRIFGLVEINNWSSIRSCDHIGFRRLGRLVAQGHGPAKTIWMPREATAVGIRLK